MKAYLKHINGGIMFFISLVLFFVGPKLYRIIDPTAGQYDAGILHNLFVAATAVSFSAGFAWFSLRYVAPGVHKILDEYIEQKHGSYSDQVTIGVWLYVMFFFAMMAAIILV